MICKSGTVPNTLRFDDGDTSYFTDRLDYDPETGVFRWKMDVNRLAKKGMVAGRVHRRGYRYIKMDRVQYRASRLAWRIVYGEWPPDQLDHKNRIRDDDRIDNLELSDPDHNAKNRSPWGTYAPYTLKDAHAQTV